MKTRNIALAALAASGQALFLTSQTIHSMDKQKEEFLDLANQTGETLQAVSTSVSNLQTHLAMLEAALGAAIANAGMSAADEAEVRSAMEKVKTQAQGLKDQVSNPPTSTDTGSSTAGNTGTTDQLTPASNATNGDSEPGQVEMHKVTPVQEEEAEGRPGSNAEGAE